MPFCSWATNSALDPCRHSQTWRQTCAGQQIERDTGRAPSRCRPVPANDGFHDRPPHRPRAGWGRKVPPTGATSSACEAANELLRVADDATADTSFAASLGSSSSASGVTTPGSVLGRPSSSQSKLRAEAPDDAVIQLSRNWDRSIEGRGATSASVRPREPRPKPGYACCLNASGAPVCDLTRRSREYGRATPPSLIPS
jgi:hypothetical protein